jgi:arylformamidase
MADQLIDISRTISETTAVWPGDTPFSRRYVMAIEEGSSCNTSTITMTTHIGAHTDAPHHYEAGAPTIDQVPLHKYIGPCRVVHARDPDAVRIADLEGIDLGREERLLFRTPGALADDAWRDDFPYLSVEVAAALAGAGVKLVGIDTPSVDPMDSKTLEAHKVLLTGGVAILEGICLDHVAAGRYELIALPLRIAGGDSSPVRAVLRPLGDQP